MGVLDVLVGRRGPVERRTVTEERTFTLYRWCDRCHRTIRVTVEMQTARPASGYWRGRWDDAARRDAEARYQEEHVAHAHAQAGGAS